MNVILRYFRELFHRHEWMRHGAYDVCVTPWCCAWRRTKYVLAFLFAASAFASAQDTCQVSGTVYMVDGKTPAANAVLVISRSDKAGRLFSNTVKRVQTNRLGVITFSAPRTTGTDSAYITIRTESINGVAAFSTPQTVAIPNAATADLAALTSAASYSTGVVAIPGLYIGKAGADSLRWLAYTLSLKGGIGVQRDTYGRVQLFLNPDSLVAGSGITAAALTDSLDANPRIPDVSARIRDSLNTIPRAETDPTATAKAQLVVKDSLNANSRGYVALRDSLRADHGFVTQSQLRDVDIKAGDGVAALPLAVASAYRDRLDTLVEQSGNLDISSPASTQSRTIVMTGFGHVQLGERSKHEVGATYKVVNRSGGISIIDYYGVGEDPDGWSGYDTIPDGSWQTVINSGTRWAVVRSDVRLAQLRDSLNTVVRTEVDPTATAKAQVVIKDTIDAKFPRTAVSLTQLADSLKKAPYGLNSPGTLGQVWKTGAGGTQGWAADSAGGAAAASLTVDTTYTAADSLIWRQGIGGHDPVSLRNYTGAAAMKVGTIVLHVVASRYVRYATIATDSANSVRLFSVEVDMQLYYVGVSRCVNRYYASYTGNAPYYLAAAGDGAAAIATGFYPVKSMVNQYRMTFMATDTYCDAYEVTLTVRYALPVANVSTTPIRIANVF